VITSYGQLDKLLVCALGSEGLWGKLKMKTSLLAVISPCKTKGQDAAFTVTHYKDLGTSIVTDIRNIKSVVGRAETRGRWGIIDRGIEHAVATFVSGDGEDSDAASDV
jgi:hypothetical protein